MTGTFCPAICTSPLVWSVLGGNSWISWCTIDYSSSLKAEDFWVNSCLDSENTEVLGIHSRWWIIPFHSIGVMVSPSFFCHLTLGVLLILSEKQIVFRSCTCLVFLLNFSIFMGAFWVTVWPPVQPVYQIQLWCSLGILFGSILWIVVVSFYPSSTPVETVRAYHWLSQRQSCYFDSRFLVRLQSQEPVRGDSLC